MTRADAAQSDEQKEPSGVMGQQQVGFEVSFQQAAVLDGPLEGAPERNQLCVISESMPPAGAIAQALAQAVEQFEVLRTTFVQPAGSAVPLQVVNTALDAPVTEVEGSARSEALDGELTAAWAEHLDVAVGPVLRARVVRYPGGSGALVLTAAAAVADVESLRILAGVLGVKDLSGDDAVEDPLQYADYAAWQTEQQEVPASIGYWSERSLDGAPLTALPRSASAAQDDGNQPRPGATALPWVTELAPAMAEFAGSLGVDTSDLWLAAWIALAQRLSGDERPVVSFIDDRRSVDE